MGKRCETLSLGAGESKCGARETAIRLSPSHDPQTPFGIAALAVRRLRLHRIGRDASSHLNLASRAFAVCSRPLTLEAHWNEAAEERVAVYEWAT